VHWPVWRAVLPGAQSVATAGPVRVAGCCVYQLYIRKGTKALWFLLKGCTSHALLYMPAVHVAPHLDVKDQGVSRGCDFVRDGRLEEAG
jgi:hypothetical protein